MKRAFDLRRRAARLGARKRRGALSVLSALAMLVSSVAMVTLATAPANAEDSGDGISYTLEGCRNNGDISLPNNDDKFLCPDAAYTTGNLGKGWNELDLVPVRVTVKAGNSAPDNQVFAFGLVVDNCSNGTGETGCTTGKPGYDVLSSDSGGTPVKNAGLSSGTCGTLTSSAPQYAAPGIGGTGTSLYRILTVAGQAKNSTCVYDAFARLALGSHEFPGASLHFNLTNDALGTAGVGAKDVSIPVNEILPQELSKTMSAVRDSAFTWTLSKSSTPATVNFADTCEPTAARTASVDITLTWTKSAANPTGYTVSTVITAKNPASRAIRVSVTDVIRAGTIPIDSVNLGPHDVAANSTYSFPTHSFNISPAQLVAAGANGEAPNFNDIATATYTDVVTSVPVPGNTTATASVANNAIGSGSTAGNSINITDSESMTGTGLDFSVAAPSVGSFTGGYVAGTYTTGPVGWSISGQTTSGSVTFNKTVRVAAATATSGTLSDTATGTFGGSTTNASASTSISSSALVDLTVNKRRSPINDANQTFGFTVKNSANQTVATPSITVLGNTSASTDTSTTVNNLPPGTYTVYETDTGGYPPVSPATANLNLPTCTGSVSFNNVAAPAGAQVRKITAPTGSTVWQFTLSGPDVGQAGTETVNATAGAGYVGFTSALNTDGATYTITETAQSGWDLTSVAGDFGGVGARATTSVANRTCSFTLDLPTDSGGLFSCSFTNTQRGSITIIKDAVPNDAQDFAFTSQSLGNFSLDDDADPTLSNSITFSNLTPGPYSVQETPAVTNWDLTNLQCNAGTSSATTNATTGVASITLAAGGSVTCTYTNTKRANAKVIKTENGTNPLHAYTFRLTGGPDNVNITRATDPAPGTGGETLDFGFVRPGSYTLCELAVPAGTTSTLASLPGATTNSTTGDVCAPITLTAGEVREIAVDNTMPGGGQRTIGYWKNWNTCNSKGGDWQAKADRSGNHLLDEFLPKSLGDYIVDSCGEAVAVLNAASGKYAENQLAAQLLAAKLNVAAGASTCSSVTTAITQADALLVAVGYNGPPSSLVGQKSPHRATALSLAGTLDNYNNGLVC